MIWSYGVTTVPQRLGDLLPETLSSLSRAGFGYPRLFVDGPPGSGRDDYEKFGLDITRRDQRVRPFGNWLLALTELYVREPNADRYAIFQDDLVASAGLREYLEKTPYPSRGYLNLYTMPSNQDLVDRDFVGWFRSNQFGRGAVGLVFDRDAVLVLLTSQSFMFRIQDVERGWKSIDGAVVTAMVKAGYSEFVHSPSLVQHTGKESSMGTKPQPLAPSFRGENFDLRELLK